MLFLQIFVCSVVISNAYALSKDSKLFWDQQVEFNMRNPIGLSQYKAYMEGGIDAVTKAKKNG